MTPLRKLPQQLEGTDLLREIEKKDRRFRVAQATFFVLITLFIAALGVANYIVIEKLNTNSIQRTAQINRLQDHIDCIVTLFQQPHRDKLTIKDLHGCKLASSPESATSPKKSTVSATRLINISPSVEQADSVAKPASSSQSTPTASSAAKSKPSPTPTSKTALDKVPVLGGVFQRLGL